MQEASSGQLVSGGAGGRLLVSGSRHRIAKKFLVVILSRPFLVLFLVPAFLLSQVPCLGRGRTHALVMTMHAKN